MKWSLSIVIRICDKNLGVPSDLLSTDARCLVIILGGQCLWSIFTARRYAVRAILVCLSAVPLPWQSLLLGLALMATFNL